MCCAEAIAIDTDAARRIRQGAAFASPDVAAIAGKFNGVRDSGKRTAFLRFITRAHKRML
jgi:hypothetical protein